MKQRVVIIGAGGHGVAIADLFQRSSGYSVLGFLDDFREPGTKHFGIDVLGRVDTFRDLPLGTRIHVGLGQVGRDSRRRDLVDRLNFDEDRYAPIVSPLCSVSPTVEIAHGSAVFPNAVLGAGVIVGAHSIVNSGAIIEHESTVGSFCHIAPGAIVSGGVRVGDNVFVGAGAIVFQGAHLKPGSVVPAGAVIRS